MPTEEIKPEIPSTETPRVGPVFFTYHHPRCPTTFSGDGDENPKAWIRDFCRIARHNQWDESLCLANVIFHLSGTARQWFENNEESFKSWETFVSALTQTFCHDEDLFRRAETTLKTRAQMNGESTEAYIQDILGLCKRVNPIMSETEKVAHLMKGVAEDVYQVLLARAVETEDDFIRICREIEAQRKRRITSKKFDRLPNVTNLSSISPIDVVEDLPSLIRRIVREEIQKALTPIPTEPIKKPLEEVIREEVGRSIAAINDRRYPQSDEVERNYTDKTNTSPNVLRPRKTDVWRTNDNRPLCYHCGRPGHVLKYCPYRRTTSPNFPQRSYERTYSRSPSPHRRSREFVPSNSRQPPSAERRRVSISPPSRRYNSPLPFRSSNRNEDQGN